MGSYRIEVAPHKRAGCSATACKKKGIKIQKGEIRLGVWVDNERFQSWSWRHWGCVTPKVLQNIEDAIGGGDEPNFELLDGFEELPAEVQAKVKKAIENGDLDDADKTVIPDEAGVEDAPNAADKPAEKAKAETKTKTKKRSRADSEEAPETTRKKDKKANGKAAVKEEESQLPKRRKARKETADAPEEPERPAKKTRGRKKKTDTIEGENEVASLGEEVETVPPTKKARGKQTASNGEKPKRGRPKRKVPEDE